MKNDSFEKAMQPVDKPAAKIIQTIGKGLKESRLELGFSIKEVAKDLHLDAEIIRAVENGSSWNAVSAVILSFYYTKYFELGYDLVRFYFENHFDNGDRVSNSQNGLF